MYAFVSPDPALDYDRHCKLMDEQTDDFLFSKGYAGWNYDDAFADAVDEVLDDQEELINARIRADYEDVEEMLEALMDEKVRRQYAIAILEAKGWEQP